MTDLFIVRQYDGFDGHWIDVSAPMNREDADAKWREYTENGTKYTSYNDIDYYSVFPANTTMFFSNGRTQF